MAVLRVIAEAVSPMVLVLAVGAGLLGCYLDAPTFANKGLRTEAHVARAVGVGLIVAAIVFYLAAVVGRYAG